MQTNFRVECRSYDRISRGSWRAFRLDQEQMLGDERQSDVLASSVRLWLPASTPMHWSIGTRSLRNHCIQFFWPQRWYMLSAFYQDTQLLHVYANVILPPTIEFDRLMYTDLELTVLVKPDLSFEVLTMAEFEHAANTLRYNEETRLSSLMALQSLTSLVQRSVGLFSVIPYHLKVNDLHQTISTCD